MNIRTLSEPAAAALPRARRILGWGIVAAAVLIFGHETWQRLVFHDPRVAQALLGGLVAALATALGTVPMLVSRPLADRTLDTLMGFGAGVMLAASAFSLVVPGLAAARAQGADAWTAGGIVGGGILLGAALLLALDRLLPHEHFIKGVEGAQAKMLRRVWLFVFAICLHNLPEDLAIGVAFGGTPAGGGLPP